VHGPFFRVDGLAVLGVILPRGHLHHVGARLKKAAWQGNGSPFIARALVLAAGVTCTTLTTVAQVADRPDPQPAPVEYARICDASGNGYFSIPGSNTCLKHGGLAPPMMGDRSVFDSLTRQPLYRDDISDRAPRETPAGLASGPARLAFDPYEQNLGPGTILAQLAYTVTFGDGFSQSLWFPDPRAEPGERIVTPPDAPLGVDGGRRNSSHSKPARDSEIVGNLRLDPYWGEANVPAIADSQQATLATIAPFPPPKGLASPYALPALSGSSNEFAAQAEGQSNLDYLSPGDKLWLQAAYEKAPPSYAVGNPQVSLSQNYVAGWSPQINFTCVFADRSKCDQKSSWDITGAYKNYWLPILNSTPFGSTLEVRNRVESPSGSAGAAGSASVKEVLIEPSLFRSPLRGFDIGAEYMYARVSHSRPAGAATDNATASGLPAFSPSTGVYEGRLRVQGAY
jgi:Porin subfamily